MTLQTSGPISFNNLRTEYQRTGALALSQLYGQPGIPASGKISLGDFYGKSMKHTKVISTNQNNINIQNLFTAAQWSDPAPKEVIINNGVTVGDYARSGFAIRSNTGRSGTLTIINNGEIQGFAGFPNSGAGGAAVYIDQAGVTVVNNWGIRGGGGAGGIGGTGGAGGTGVYYALGPNEGWQYNESTYRWNLNTGQTAVNVYYGGLIYSAAGNDSTVSVDVGGYRYYRGAYTGRIGTQYYYQVSRAVISYPYYVAGHGGGAGGNGGYGQGYGVSRSNGLGGAGGGNNGGNSGTGGTGGTGGNGGTWGAAGAAGNTGGTGATGNAAGGLAGHGGGGGGAAGRAVGGPVAATVINNNTINGAY